MESIWMVLVKGRGWHTELTYMGFGRLWNSREDLTQSLLTSREVYLVVLHVPLSAWDTTELHTVQPLWFTLFNLELNDTSLANEARLWVFSSNYINTQNLTDKFYIDPLVFANDNLQDAGIGFLFPEQRVIPVRSRCHLAKWLRVLKLVF